MTSHDSAARALSVLAGTLGLLALGLAFGCTSTDRSDANVAYPPPPAADLELAFTPYPSSGARPVLAHYMSWFRWREGQGGISQEHWGWNGDPTHDPRQVDASGRRDVASVYIPRIGPYDSQDPATLEYHILTAKAAGIQGFIVDWYKPDDNVDLGLRALIEQARRLDFTVAVCLEEKTCFPDWAPVASRQEAVDLMIGKLGYILREYGDSPVMWRQDGKLPVLLFGGWDSAPGIGEKIFTPAEWQQIRQAMPRQDWTLVRQNFKAEYGPETGAFAWVGDEAYRDWYHRTSDAMQADGRLAISLSSANPGFDSRGTNGWGHGATVTDRDSGALYQAWWQAAAASDVDAIQIVTWNDFAEGTVIEPTREFGRRYIDVTERHIGQLNGRPVNLADNELPYRWYVLRRQLAAAQPEAQLPPVATWLATGKTDRAARAIDELVRRHELSIPAALTATDEFAPGPDARELTPTERALFRRLNSPANALLGAPVQASSQESAAYGAAAVTDGDPQTRWASEHRDGQSLTLALPESVASGELVLVWEAAYAAQIRVSVSADGREWTPIAERPVSGPAPMFLTLSSDQAFRQVRLEFPTRATKWGVSLWDVGFYP